jgi:hypothetical protein
VSFFSGSKAGPMEQSGRGSRPASSDSRSFSASLSLSDSPCSPLLRPEDNKKYL